MNSLTLKEAFIFLSKKKVTYKKKSILPRTMRTMLERDVFKTAFKQSNVWFISEIELIVMASKGELHE